jgi:hypothetical protein
MSTDNVPGRYSFSIGVNPFLLSDTSGIFTLSASEVSYVTPSAGPSAISTKVGGQTYNGCGLPVLPDYTYTGYQHPCTTTTNGQVETLYPIVPASDSSSFFGVIPPAPTITPLGSTSASISSASDNALFATGLYAQALQCPTPVTPSATRITVGDATTIFSLIDCKPSAASTSNPNSGDNGICHTSGYTTFSVSRASSVCCPGGWATMPLNSEIFCFTSMGALGAKRDDLAGRQVSTETLGFNSQMTLVEISGLAFTHAGVVTREAVVAGDLSTSTSAGKSSSTATATGLATTPTNSDGVRLNLRFLERLAIVGVFIFCNV